MNFIEQMDASAYANWIRTSDLIYPLLQVVHIVGISLVVGSLILSNMRILGAASQLPVQDFGRHLYRWVVVGLVLFLVTGVHMVLSFFVIFAVNPVMWIKMGLLIVAVGINVYLYRSWFAVVNPLETGIKHKSLAVLSILLLVSIIVMGKLLAYIGGKD